MTSWIQKHALYVLLRSKNATVKQMRPPAVEANLFSYHLDGLQADGYVEKVGRGTYTLTTQGQRFVGAFSTSTNRASEFIKTVVMLYGKTSDGRYLLFRWSRQPYIGKVNLPHDHMPLGKSLEDGVRDAMADKLGSDATPRFMTSALVRIEHDGELISHMNALVYQVDVTNVNLPFTSRNGTAFFDTLDDKIDAMNGLANMVERIEKYPGISELTLTY